ncbi:MAG TPA: pepsin/retropepsin-like aspartic protease family protein [Candidatus Tumulicola sp.]
MRILCALAALALLAATAAPPDDPQVASILQRRARTLAQLHVVYPKTIEMHGTLGGLGETGTFHRWRDGDRERYDQAIGVRTLQTVRIGDSTYVRNSYGDVQTVGVAAAGRQRTEDWIDTNAFVQHPETVTPIGPGASADGRSVFRVRIAAPDGPPYGIGLDTATGMIDEKAYPEGGRVTTIEYYDYAVADGALYARRQVQSNGDSALDVTTTVTSVVVNRPIDAATFEIPQNVRIDTQSPASVPLLLDKGLIYVRATANGKPLLLLVDSGSQGVVLSPDAAARLGLHPQGTIEIQGARQTKGAGIAPLDAIQIGEARLPVNIVSVVDLNGLAYTGKPVDGVLGFPLFAAAEVRIDPQKSTLTVAQPGALPPQGVSIPVDVARSLPEIVAKLDNRVDGRFVVDTGDASDLLVFHSFIEANPGVVFYGASETFADNKGVGGSSSAVPAAVDRLQLGPFTMYNRYANILLEDRGAFADGGDAGNVGYGTLKNFVLTFDVQNHVLFLDKTRWFDDGRYRPRYERM